MNNKCTDCNGTGLLETEGIQFGELRWSHTDRNFGRDVYHDGYFKMTQCHCVGEEDYLWKPRRGQ